jgi:hypothetical protein
VDSGVESEFNTLAERVCSRLRFGFYRAAAVEQARLEATGLYPEVGLRRSGERQEPDQGRGEDRAALGKST